MSAVITNNARVGPFGVRLYDILLSSKNYFDENSVTYNDETLHAAILELVRQRDEGIAAAQRETAKLLIGAFDKINPEINKLILKSHTEHHAAEMERLEAFLRVLRGTEQSDFD